MKEEKRILITGAGGNLGGRLTKLLADETEYEVIAVSSFPEKIQIGRASCRKRVYLTV